MIAVTRFDGSKLYVNVELIQTIEGTPDAVITLTNGVKIIAKERPEELVEKILDYQRLIRNPELRFRLGE